jgi:3-isopropylmalate/(R)-2-methylmalate dehydratase small subunit
MMERFTVLRGPAAPLMLADVNTDLIAPAHGGRGTAAENAFAPLRYLPDGSDDPEFVLNRPAFRAAPILLVGRNFGCGSSRESAVWSLLALGIRCVIAESFGDIFAGNCFQNGLLPIVLPKASLDALARDSSAGGAVTVDLEACIVTASGGAPIPFDIVPTRRTQLMEGLDDLDLGLRRRALVRDFERRDRERRPWVHDLSSAG